MAPICIVFGGNGQSAWIQWIHGYLGVLVGIKFVGFLFMLVGLGAFYLLWLNALKNRAKRESEHEEYSAELAASVAATQAATGTRQFSLAPVPVEDIYAECEDDVQVSNVLKPSVAPEIVVAEELDDMGAKTHLEIARQFFQMGDYEGAKEMAELVNENGAASTKQRQMAEAIITDCI